MPLDPRPVALPYIMQKIVHIFKKKSLGAAPPPPSHSKKSLGAAPHTPPLTQKNCTTFNGFAIAPRLGLGSRRAHEHGAHGLGGSEASSSGARSLDDHEASTSEHRGTSSKLDSCGMNNWPGGCALGPEPWTLPLRPEPLAQGVGFFGMYHTGRERALGTCHRMASFRVGVGLCGGASCSFFEFYGYTLGEFLNAWILERGSACGGKSLAFYH